MFHENRAALVINTDRSGTCSNSTEIRETYCSKGRATIDGAIMADLSTPVWRVDIRTLGSSQEG